MSTAFRSRIKSVANYDDIDEEVGTAFGTCCKQDGTKAVSSFSECSTEGGYFQLGEPDEVECPDKGVVGCCCACKYVGDLSDFIANYQSGYVKYDSELTTQGVKDNVSLCECNRLGGKWFYGPCSSIPESITTTGVTGAGDLTLLCGKNENGIYNDVRTPGACCKEDGSCTNICTSAECLVENGGTGSFNNALPCGVGDQNCQGGFNSQFRGSLAPTVISTCYELKTVNNEYTYTCSLKTENNCSNLQGFWDAPSTYTSGIKTCNSTSMYPPRRGTGSIRALSPTISKSKLPNVGDNFQGGMYLGIFHPNDSTIEYRDRIDNSLIRQKSEFDINGERKFSWALILSFDFFGDLYRMKNRLSSVRLPMKNTNEKYKSYRISKHDGFFNTHGNGFAYSGINYQLFKDIKNLKYMGFNDWYVPAIKELNFIYKNISSTLVESKRNVSKYQNFLDDDLRSNMMSSTIFDMNDEYGIQSESPVQQVINTKAYVYGQYMNKGDDTDGGKIFISDQAKSLVVPICRRLIVTN